MPFWTIGFCSGAAGWLRCFQLRNAVSRSESEAFSNILRSWYASTSFLDAVSVAPMVSAVEPYRWAGGVDAWGSRFSSCRVRGGFVVIGGCPEREGGMAHGICSTEL